MNPAAPLCAAVGTAPVLPPGQRVAVVGAGIAGLATAYLLARGHRVTLFEAESRLGGHTHTVDVTLEGQTAPVDTGFLVFNERTYPNLMALFAELGVASVASQMSFGVSLDGGRLEWAGTNLNTVFAQRRNVFSPRFWSMLRDILRFHREAVQWLEQGGGASGLSLGELLQQGGYGAAFRDDYLLPMAAAIWSSAPAAILDFPAATFVRFCTNHALLQVNDRPQWFTVAGGGRSYVQRIAATLTDVRTACPVQRVQRHEQGVTVQTAAGSEAFDAVVLASHAPDSLALLSDASALERQILGAVQYQPNTAVLHTDAALLPQRKAVQSAWNYLGRRDATGARPVCVSYLINRLQPLPFQTPVVVTLNPIAAPRPDAVLATHHYAHPVFDAAAIAAQQRLPGLQGQRRTWFAGAWAGYGFHEDGLRSALQVARDFGVLPHWGQP